MGTSKQLTPYNYVSLRIYCNNIKQFMKIRVFFFTFASQLDKTKFIEGIAYILYDSIDTKCR
jgi:hypothetical protein